MTDGRRTAHPFLGLGCGRCGTVSLARLVDGCENATASHENPAFRSPWERPDERALEAFVEYARWGIANGQCVGDVALYWLPHLERIRAAVPALRVVVLQRDEAATVASLTRKCPGYTLVRPGDRDHAPEWWDLFPTIDAPSIEAAWTRYYRHYYERAAASARPDTLWLRTEELNDDAALTRVFVHLGIPEADRRLPGERRHNAGDTTVVAHSQRAPRWRRFGRRVLATARGGARLR